MAKAKKYTATGKKSGEVYIRTGRKISGPAETYGSKTFPSINLAKKESRSLQAAGHTVSVME